MQLYSVVNQRNVSPWGSSVSGTCSFCRGDPTRSCKDWDCETLSTPTDATSVGQFLDLASYYRRFVPSFATVAAPLHTLTRKNAVSEWSADCEAAFAKLKELLTTTPVLTYPKFGPECSSSWRLMLVPWNWVQSFQASSGWYYTPYSLCLSFSRQAWKELWDFRTWNPWHCMGCSLLSAVSTWTPEYCVHRPCSLSLHTRTLRPSGKLAFWDLTIQVSPSNTDQVRRIPMLMLSPVA